MLKRYHRGCGGEVRYRKCLRCGKKWHLLRYGFAGDIEEKQVRFDEEEYRKRIREGRDLPK